MSGPKLTRTVSAAIIATPLLFAAIAVLQVRIDVKMRSATKEKEELLLRSGDALKKLSFGYDSLMADIYWTRAVQYYGERVGKKGANFELLAPLLDITTTLDPNLIVAYRFGSVFLSERGTGGLGRSDLAIELVNKGIAANPSEWRLYTDLGSLYYLRLKDYPNASAAYLAGSRIPGAPLWMKLIAARIAEKGGSIETSRAIWSELYETTKDPNLRKKALEEIQGLKAQEDESQLDELADEYYKRFGRFPSSTKEMRDAGLLSGIPVDPAGFPYVFGPDGKSHLSAQSSVEEPNP
jgi:tetratricopeptide (TPR) repeat protein